MRKSTQLLDAGLRQLGFCATVQQQDQLLSFLQLLEKWNKAFNLTAVRDPQEMIIRHLLDSLVVNPYLCGERLIDVGTGAGLPGIPLSVFNPEKAFFLLDSNQKKQIFVNQAAKSLSLTNVTCVNSTVETYQASQKFSTILTRAFAPLTKMITITSHLLAQDGRFLAMMGKISDGDLSVPEGYTIQEIVVLNVPFEKAQRHVAIISRALVTK